MPRHGTLTLAVSTLGFLPLASLRAFPAGQYRGRSFPRSTQEPEPGSRRLYAGCRLGGRQDIPQAPPENFAPSSVSTSLFVDLDASSAVHSRSSSRLSPDVLLGRLFRNAHHPGRCAGAAYGGLEPPPAGRLRGAHPHLLCSTVSGGPTSTSGPPATFVAHRKVHLVELNAHRLSGPMPQRRSGRMLSYPRWVPSLSQAASAWSVRSLSHTISPSRARRPSTKAVLSA
jgi:hypothetical protein